MRIPTDAEKNTIINFTKPLKVETEDKTNTSRNVLDNDLFAIIWFYSSWYFWQIYRI
jgi:hypothetical protein